MAQTRIYHPPTPLDLTFADLQASHLSARSVALAQHIAEQKPDLLALQEDGLWRIGPTPDTVPRSSMIRLPIFCRL